MNSSLSENNCMMQGFGDSVDKNSGKQAFWKTNANLVPGSIKPVYGAQHPPKQEFMPSTPTKDLVGKNWPHRTSSSSSFQDFQESISDAWDIDDDDILMCSGNEIRLSHEVVQKAAMTVISNHSQQCKPSTSKVMSDTAKAQAMQRLATQRVIEPPHNTSGVPVGPGVGVRQGGSFKQSCVPISYKHSSHSSLPDRETAKLDKFKTLLEAPNTDLEELRSLSWSGIPKSVRPVAWRLLSGYLPANFERRNLTLERKREEYFNYVKQYYHTRLDDNHDTYRQIHIDIPRMCPLISLFQQDVVQEIFERILFIWAIRHPASGYVQGINDLVTPFFVVFLSEFLDEAADVETFNVASLSSDSLNIIEADSFWCMSKLLDGIQDNYTFAQPGIQLKVNALRDLIQRIDEPLHQHLEKHSVEYLQFSFRWMNNLLMREIPLRCTIRLWDTYQSEPDGFASFHLYVCAAFLTRWSEQLLREKDFQGMMLLLQNLPTRLWSNEEIGLLLAEAYRLKYMFADAPKHLKTQTSVNSKKQST